MSLGGDDDRAGVDPSSGPEVSLPVPLEAGRLLARTLVKRVVVPLVTSGLLDLDEVISLIRNGVVHDMNGANASNRQIAAHFSKSRRWYQDQLRQARGGTEPPQVLREEGGAEPGTGPGSQFMLRMLAALAQRHPEGLSLEELRVAMDVPAWHIEDSEFQGRIELYLSMGLVEAVGQDRGGLVLRLPNCVMVGVPGPSQLEKLGERLSWMFPLAMAHCEGQGEFGGILARLSPKALSGARRRIRAAVGSIIAEAVSETHVSEQPEDTNTDVRVIIAIGEV